MARSAYPYTVTPCDVATCPVVGATPVLDTRRRFGFGSMVGLIFGGNKKSAIPVQKPYGGQGAKFPAFPYVQPSSVSPDIIQPAIFIAINNFSPSGHSNPLSNVIPVPAMQPRMLIPTPQGGRRSSGAPFVPPYPLSTYGVPTAPEWDKATRRNRPPVNNPIGPRPGLMPGRFV